MMRTIKRDGGLESFDANKIQRALLLAFNQVRSGDIPNVAPLVKDVMERLRGVVSDKTVTVLDVSRATEDALMAAGHLSCARAYIIYRHDRDLARARRQTPDAECLPNYIVASKYARHRLNLGRREVWSETVARDRAMHLAKFPGLEKEIIKAFGFVDRKEVLPSMRSMQFAGDAVSDHNARMYNCSFTLIDRWRAFQEAFYLLLCGCGVGYSVQWRHIDQLGSVLRVDRSRVVHHTVGDTIIGWADALGALISSFTTSGTWVEFNYSNVRAEGRPLRTSGGTAPGHLALQAALEAIRGLLLAAQGRRIRPLEGSDIMCLLAEAVLAGGIRRSSLIGLFDSNNDEMIYAKARGNFDPSPLGLNSHRQMVNLSAVLLRGATHRSVFDRLVRVADENYGDPGFIFVEDLDHGTNPCFIGSTLLHTNVGMKRISDLVNAGPQQVTQVDGSVLAASEVTCNGRDVPVYTVELETGHSVTATAYHRFSTYRGAVSLKDLVIGDLIELQNMEGSWGIHGTYAQGLTLGLWMGDGTSHGNESHICLWGDDQRWADYIQENVNSCLETTYTWYQSSGAMRLGSNKLNQYVGNLKTVVPDSVMCGSREIVCGFLEGMFFCDCSIMGTAAKGYSLRLNQSNKPLLQQVQVLLSNFGIQSKIYLRRDAGERSLPGRANYELTLNRNNMIHFVNRVGLFGPKREKFNVLGPQTGQHHEVIYSFVRSITPAGRADVYCLNQPLDHKLVANGMETLNCGEIGLEPILSGPCIFCSPGSQANKLLGLTLGSCSVGCVDGQLRATGFAFCNLCEINMATVRSESDYIDRCWAASFIGTLQASYTSFPYLGAVTEAICERDALLGLGMCGIQNNRAMALDGPMLRRGAAYCISVNEDTASLIGINAAARVTTVKPGGTGPLVLGVVGAGIHRGWAPRAFRRVVANPGEAVAAEFRRVNPHMVDVMPNGDWSLVFPVEFSGATLRDETALGFCEDVMLVYDNWVKPGTTRGSLTHNVSCSVTLRPGERADVCSFIWENRGSIAAMAFSPYLIDQRFPYAPWQACVSAEDEARWDNLVSQYRPVDWEAFREASDGTLLRNSVACGGGGGACAL